MKYAISAFSFGAFAATPAFSQTLEPDGFLSEIIARTSDIAAQFQDVAESLFFLLIVVNMIWIFGKLVLSAGTFSDLVKELAKLIVFSGMVIALINVAPLIPGFILENAGEIAERGSSSASGRPGEIFTSLLSIAGQTTVSFFNPLGGVVGVVAGILITIFAAGIAAFIVIAIIEAHLIGGVGVILLGFGGWDLTSDIAKTYLRWALGTTLKLVTVFLLAGVIVEVSRDWNTFSFNPVTNIENVLAVIGLMLISFIMIMVVPSTVQQIASGSSFSSSAEAGMSAVKMTAAVAAIAGTKGAGAIAGGAGKLAGLAGAGGGPASAAMSAVNAATQSVGQAAAAGSSNSKANPATVNAINKAAGK